ncbi:MAG: histidine phosphatase family protein [Candidatus Aenigmarchaeota archaeon]|nr:histidine phosphatase family protein [Candidatus Aenigmarchaeota archaeon]
MRRKKTVSITYFVHGTTTDNENGIATGWKPGRLSKLGIEQSIKLRGLVKGKRFDNVFCSDLKRAAESARLTFRNKIPVVRDKRLRECNYGVFTGKDAGKVASLMEKHINKPFPEGESYRDVEKRIRDFIKDLKKDYAGKRIAVVAHQAPQLALDVIIKGKTWKQAIKEDWRRKVPKEWRPGWSYKL